MAVRIVNRRGKEVVLLNPSERGRKFAAELKSKVRITNLGEIKSKNGVVMTLSKEQAAFRSGYLQARKDNAKAYKARQRKRAGKRSGGKKGSK